MSLLDRITAGRTPARMTLDDYGQLFNSYTYGLNFGQPPTMFQTLAGSRTERPSNTFEGLAAQAFAANGVVFACMMVRQLVFSSIRFQFQRFVNGKPSETFGDRTLSVLERPWPGGTTQDLLSRMIQDADLAGNSYWVRDGDELVRLRPDWVQIVGVPRSMDKQSGGRGAGQVGWKKAGYIYTEGGIGNGDGVPFTVDEVVHFAPTPDPLAVFAGMSWITPVLRELAADQAMTKHQSKFFDRGATVNMIIKHSPLADPDAVRRWADEMQSKHGGVDNAWKNLNLYPGADATPVGSNMKDIDFKSVRGGGETRIAAAAGVPPVIVGLSEGLAASTYSNYIHARRRLADATAHPLWQNMAGSFERLVPPPDGASRLWYDANDVPFLREDEKDAAEIQQVRAATIASLISSGFYPESAVSAVEANDFIGLLQHTGLTSVQLQKPGTTQEKP